MEQPIHQPDPETPPVPEAQTPDPQQRIDNLTQQLDESHRTIHAMERRQRIDQLLTEADAVDLDAARLLTEAAVSNMDDADVQTAVADLRRHKPHLFRSPARSQVGAPTAGAMAPRSREPLGTPADEAAAHAAVTGDRRDLLAYLRLKRGS